eukprot:scaffold26724_cov120-Isochrysis_galbana.AAC.3
MSCSSQSDDEDYMCGWQRVLMRRQKAVAAHADAIRERHLNCKRKMPPIPAAEEQRPDQPQMMFTSRMCMEPPSIGTRCAESPSKPLRIY